MIIKKMIQLKITNTIRQGKTKIKEKTEITPRLIERITKNL